MKNTYKISYLDNKPYIRLSGKWLKENGFDIGDRFKITKAKGILLLTKISKEELEKENRIKEIKRLKELLKN